MSDETADPHLDGAEPSMEDILASIRRIIADEDGAESGGVELKSVEMSEESLSIVDTLPEVAVEASEFDIAEITEASDSAEGVEVLELTDLDTSTDELDVLDLGDKEVDPLTEREVQADNSDIDFLLSELDGEMGDDEAFGSMSSETVSEVSDTSAQSNTAEQGAKLKGLGAVAAAAIGAVAAAGGAAGSNLTTARRSPSPETTVENDGTNEALDLMFEGDSDNIDSEINALLEIPSAEDPKEDDIDALLGDMLFEEDETVVADEMIVDPAESLLEPRGEDISDELLSDLLGDESSDELDLPAPTPALNDLDLVKSLMADLTDDPYDSTEEMVESDDPEADLVDDILSLSIEDEIESDGPETDSVVAEPEIEDVLAMPDVDTEPKQEIAASDAFVIDIREDLSETLSPKETSPASALAEIAASAEAEAELAEQRSVFAATGFAAGAGMMIASAGPVAETVKSDQLESGKDASNTQEADEILAAIDPSNAEIEAIEAETVATHIEKQTKTETAETAQEINPTEETAAMPKAAAKKEAIVDNVTEEVAAGAFASLNQVVEEKAVMADRGDRIGDLVQEALRPMLKEWLDKNLKGIVERAVTKEVKRISTGK
jgi:cell pole-organizing protein PopZ